MNGYNLLRDWYNYKFSNPSKVKAMHSDMYCYLIDLWNRLGQKDEFGLPTQVTMEALGIGSYNTYKKTFEDLIQFGFVKLIADSKNQYQSKIIALSKNDKAPDKAPDKALDKAHIKATDTIYKQETIEQIYIPTFIEFLKFAIEQVPNINKDEVKLKYESWKVNNWKDGNNKQIKNWKTKLLNTLPYISKIEVKQPRQIFD